MKKILSFIIIIFILYIISIFKVPTLANEIEKLLNIQGFNQQVINIKKKLDNFWAKVPTKDELQNYYSWALNSIEKTKQNIDNIRRKADELEKTYNTTKEKIEDIKQTVEKISEVGKNINNIMSNTWTVN